MSTPDYYAYDGGRMTEEQRKNLDAWRVAWVAELRSGKYTQGRGKLCKHGKHCCLGVLAEMAVTAKHFKKEATSMHCYFGPKGDVSYGSLTPDFEGLLVSPINGLSSLWQLNDNAGYTFDQIADVIESRNVRLDNGAIL
jgi:hypothetical protein